MNSIDLGGHSGCRIFLMEEDDGHVFVRKISKDKDYNDRLKTQSEKQASFVEKTIKAPKVLDSGFTEDGLYYFDMEYIQGITLSEYIKTMEIGKVSALIESLVDSVVPKIDKECSERQKAHTVVIFAKKLKALHGSLDSLNNDIINKSLELLEAHDWGNLPTSQCHGDMTLENIIIKNDQIYLIDFLDSFFDSWLLDISTLLQDVEMMWSYRFQENVSMNTVLRLIVFRDVLIDEIGKTNQEYVLEIYYLLLQKLIRIYPYTKDEHTYNFLNEKIKIVLESIRRLERRSV